METKQTLQKVTLEFDGEVWALTNEGALTWDKVTKAEKIFSFTHNLTFPPLNWVKTKK